MKSKNGFTIVELLVSLSLTLVVIIVLFEIIVVLKDLFQVSSLKTELLNKKSILVENIYSDINSRLVSRIEQCGDYCLDFTMNDASTKRLQIDKENLIISYGDYAIKLNNTYSIGNIYFSNDMTNYISTEKNNGIFNVRIPIYSKVTNDENLGINIVATYNTSGMAIGSLYIADLNENECLDGIFCKDKLYAVGNQVKLGNYNWHIVKDEESSVTLLLDGNEIPNRSHVVTGMSSYKWSTSYINKYLNDTFYKSLLSSKIDETEILTKNKGVCDDESGKGGNPGVLNTEQKTCKSDYIYSNVRLMSLSEFEEIKKYLQDNNIDSSFLYSDEVGKWALINADSKENKIMLVNSDGSTGLETYSALLNVRPIVVIMKK